MVLLDFNMDQFKGEGSLTTSSFNEGLNELVKEQAIDLNTFHRFDPESQKH